MVDSEVLERIETKIAYLERANAELSEVVFRQHHQIDALRERLTALVQRIEAGDEAPTPRSAEDERPPHY